MHTHTHLHACAVLRPYAVKNKSIDAVAYLPAIPEPEGMSTNDFRILKLMVYHAAYERLLAQLKAMAAEGDLLQDPEGTMQHVVPIVLSIVGDNPEISAMACVYASFSSLITRLCQRCLGLTKEFSTPASLDARYVL